MNITKVDNGFVFEVEHLYQKRKTKFIATLLADGIKQAQEWIAAASDTSFASEAAV